MQKFVTYLVAAQFPIDQNVQESHAGVNPSSSSSIRAIDEAARTPYLESPITSTHGQDLPVSRPSNSKSMSQTTLSLFVLV